jgi:hypothetical protein
MAPPRLHRSKALGRVAAILFLGSGLVTLVTLPLPAPSDFQRAGTLIVAVAAIAVGTFAWKAPWDRWPRRASLWLAPLALALIAAGNVLGGSQPYTFGVFFIVVFVWIGLAHSRWISAWMALPATLAYVCRSSSSRARTPRP